MSTVPSGQHTISWIVGDSKSVWGFFTGEVNTMSFFNSRGDVNSDGVVDIVDATVLINYLLDGDDTGVDLEAANCDFRGNVDIVDATTLINYLLMGHWP